MRMGSESFDVRSVVPTTEMYEWITTDSYLLFYYHNAIHSHGNSRFGVLLVFHTVRVESGASMQKESKERVFQKEMEQRATRLFRVFLYRKKTSLLQVFRATDPRR